MLLLVANLNHLDLMLLSAATERLISVIVFYVLGFIFFLHM